jgi:hypothetical protein
MRKWYHSRVIWFNIIMTIIDIAAYLQGAKLFDQSVIPLLVTIQGLGNVILRVWFTNMSLGKINHLTLEDYIKDDEIKEPAPMELSKPIESSFTSVVPPDSRTGLTIENYGTGEFLKNSTGTIVISLKNNGAPVSGALVTADYYKPDDTLFLHNQTFSEIDLTGMYFHALPIPPDAEEGTYKAIIQAVTEKIDKVNFADSFTEPDGPAANWRVMSGDWIVQNGVFRQIKENFINSAVVSIPQALEWANYIFEADVKWDSNKSGQLGILGRWLSPTVFYCLYFEPDLEGGKLILRRENRVVQAIDYPLSYPSTFIKLKMVFSGNNIKCYVGDSLKIDFTDEAPIKKGTVGLYTQNIAASFDNVEIRQQEAQISSSLIANFNVKAPVPA